VFELKVEDLDLENRRAPVRIEGGDTRWITWGRGTAMLLPRYLKGPHPGGHCSCRTGAVDLIGISIDTRQPPGEPA
jgi:hypothetical protein